MPSRVLKHADGRAAVLTSHFGETIHAVRVVVTLSHGTLIADLQGIGSRRMVEDILGLSDAALWAQIDAELMPRAEPAPHTQDAAEIVARAMKEASNAAKH